MDEVKSGFNRRQFLSLASFGLASFGLRVDHSHADGPASQKQEDRIIERALGRTGIRVPIVSMGVMNSSNPELIRQSYEAGVRLFDTAMGYQGGRNEEMVGGVLEKIGARGNVVIVTKVPAPGSRRRGTTLAGSGTDSVKEEYLKNVEGCLTRLRTDFVDVLLVHNVSTAEGVRNPGVMEALSVLRKEGKARCVGVSTHSQMETVLNEVVRADFYDVVLTSFNFTMADDTQLLTAIENASRKGIGLMAMKTQGGGRRRTDLGAMNHTAALKWVLRNEHIATAVPGFTNFEQVKEDFTVARSLELTAEESAFLEDRANSASMGFCAGCEECVETCPGRVDIPDLMRAHMYAAQYGNFDEARATLDVVDWDRGLGTCAACSECRARCTRSVNIGCAIQELKVLFA